jgi:hypothetical protein
LLNPSRRSSPLSDSGSKSDGVLKDEQEDALAETLLQQGFRTADEFGEFITYKRENDPLQIHVGPDGSFAAFNGDDEVIAEGRGAQDLYSILVEKTVRPPKSKRAAAGRFARRPNFAAP